MRHIFLLLFCGCSLVESARFPVRKYFYVDIKKTWYEARTYCQQHYSDLAMFSSVEEAALAVKPAGFSSAYAWIGLLDEPQDWKGFMTKKENSWKWSATGQGSRTGYQTFNAPIEPNYGLALEQCVNMNPSGNWHDSRCSDIRAFVCFTETNSSLSYTFVSSGMSWPNALRYCRQHHTDLVMIEDAATNDLIFNLKPAVNTWIGLSRNPWTWADGSAVTFNNWVGGSPSIAGAQHCVAEDDTHGWKAAGCQSTNPFLCQEVLIVKTTVTLNIQSSGNLNDMNVSQQLLQQVRLTVLSKQGFRAKHSLLLVQTAPLMVLSQLVHLHSASCPLS